MLLRQIEDALNAFAIYSSWAVESCGGLLWGQWKACVSELAQVMPSTAGLYPRTAPMGWHSTALLRTAFPGLEAGRRCLSAQSAGAHVPVLVTAAVAMFNMEGGSFYQASPAGCPWSHQTCHLSHSTGLVQAKTHVLHIMPFLLHFPLGSAPTTAVSTTNLGVHHIFALKLIIAAPQTVPEGWGKAAAKPRTPLLPVPAFPGYRHWGECVWPPG